VYRQFSMNGYRFRVWIGRDGIMFVSCFSVIYSHEWLFLYCTILAVSATRLVCIWIPL